MLLLRCHHSLLLGHVLTLLRQIEALLWQVGEVSLWHHGALLLALHDEVVCSLLSKTMVLVVATRVVGLGLRVLGRRRGMLLIRSLGLDLGIGVLNVVLRRRYLGQVMVHLDVGRHRGRLAHRLRLGVPWELSYLKR